MRALPPSPPPPPPSSPSPPSPPPPSPPSPPSPPPPSPPSPSPPSPPPPPSPPSPPPPPSQGSDELVSINVGGARHSLPCAVLASYPRSRLGRLAKLWRWRRRRGGGGGEGGGGGQRDAGPGGSGGGGHPHPLQLCDDVGASSEFFFDRSAEAFECVLHFYRTGRLHLRESLCAVSFGQELEYWGLEDALLASCCQDRYSRRNAAADDRGGGEDGAGRDADRDSDSDGEGGGSERGRCRRLRRAIWATLERPDSSRASRAVAAVSVAFVVLSIANMALVSAPEFAPAAGDDEATALGVLEGVCMAWFTGELALRFACARRKRRFAARFVNIVDLVAIAPFYVTLAVERLAGASTELENVGRVVQVLKLSRSLRMLKLGRHSTGLKALGVTIKQCHEEVGLLLLFFSVGVSIFSVLEYALESSCPGTGFTSVPSAWWWATTSMTTVGYGDVRPDTTAGKLAAFACILSGLLVLALPIAIINDKFAAFYRALRLRDAAERHGRALRGLARAQEDGDADGDAGPRANLRDAYARHVLGALRGITASFLLKQLGALQCSKQLFYLDLQGLPLGQPPPFYRSVLQTWSSLAIRRLNQPRSAEDLVFEPILRNPQTKLPSTTATPTWPQRQGAAVAPGGCPDPGRSQGGLLSGSGENAPIGFGNDEAPLGPPPPELSVVPLHRHCRQTKADHNLCRLENLPEVPFENVKRKVLYSYMVRFHQQDMLRNHKNHAWRKALPCISPERPRWRQLYSSPTGSPATR
ncbi:potassium voltage-gated channel subfamily V member 1-like [Lampetra fluviatilis]